MHNVVQKVYLKTTSPDRTTNENILFLSSSLLNVLLTTSNLIKRQEYAHAYQSLSNVQKYILWLIRIATQQTNHWESPTKSLEKDIDQDWYSAFRLTTITYHRSRIRRKIRGRFVV